MKMTLSKQITIIFVSAFLITLILLSIFLNQSLLVIYENVIYNRLESEGKTISLYFNSSNYTPADNIGFIAFTDNPDDYITSNKMPAFLDDSAVALLIKKATLQNATSGSYVNSINDQVLYYSIFKYNGFFDVVQDKTIIVLTDDTIIRHMTRSTFLKLFLYCFIAFFIGYLIILIWTRRLIGHIKFIKKGIESLSLTFYKKNIQLKRNDELGELVTSVNTMRGQIYTNNQTKQELIQGISHDLKTPISVIKSYAEALEDGISSPREVAEITLKQAKRLDEKVTNLLNLTRLDYILVNPGKPIQTRIDALIKEIIPSYHYQTKAHINLDIHEGFFDGDRESWRIVIENILDNAIRYAKSSIIIQTSDHYLSIYNDGEPIDETYMNAMFQPYEKSHDGIFGLGLSIVHKTVLLYGYIITVRNQDGGVIFIIKKQPIIS